MKSPHPRIWAKGSRSGLKVEPLAAVVYAPTPVVGRWIESELERDSEATFQIARSMHQLVAALVDDPSPPRVLILDIDAVEPGDLFALHEIRPRGWFGSIVAIGNVPLALRESLGIDRVLTPPFSKDQLRDLFASLRAPLVTVQIEIKPDLLLDDDPTIERLPPVPTGPPPANRVRQRSSALRAAQLTPLRRR